MSGAESEAKGGEKGAGDGQTEAARPRLSLDIAYAVNEARMHNGLRHHDYRRYRYVIVVHPRQRGHYIGSLEAV